MVTTYVHFLYVSISYIRPWLKLYTHVVRAMVINFKIVLKCTYEYLKDIHLLLRFSATVKRVVGGENLHICKSTCIRINIFVSFTVQQEIVELAPY